MRIFRRHRSPGCRGTGGSNGSPQAPSPRFLFFFSVSPSLFFLSRAETSAGYYRRNFSPKRFQTSRLTTKPFRAPTHISFIFQIKLLCRWKYHNGKSRSSHGAEWGSAYPGAHLYYNTNLQKHPGHQAPHNVDNNGDGLPVEDEQQNHSTRNRADHHHHTPPKEFGLTSERRTGA